MSSAVRKINAECAVCHTEQCGAMLLPCYHVSCCYACASQLKKHTEPCPRCDTRVDDFVLVKLLKQTL